MVSLLRVKVRCGIGWILSKHLFDVLTIYR